ncbi:MAG: chromate transporter [Bacillota bacterium]
MSSHNGTAGKTVKLFASFFSIGIFTFGGGWSMIPLIRAELVDRRRWLTTDGFLNSLAVAQTAPGSIAVNVAVFLGYRIAGLPGVVAATLGAVLPSFLVILAVASFFLRVQDQPWLTHFFAGVRPAVLALIALAAWELGSTVLRDWRSWAFALAAMVLVLGLHVHPSLVLLGGIAASPLFFRRTALVRQPADRESTDAEAAAADASTQHGRGLA